MSSFTKTLDLTGLLGTLQTGLCVICRFHTLTRDIKNRVTSNFTFHRFIGDIINMFTSKVRPYEITRNKTNRLPATKEFTDL